MAIKHKKKHKKVATHKPLKALKNGAQKVDRTLSFFVRLMQPVKNNPTIAHLIRAIERFNDRLGSQFGAAITYFSFLSLIPLLMVTFAAAGSILNSNPELLDDLINGIVKSISYDSLANTLENTVRTAVAQRRTLGITGLVLALYSGLNWVSSLREGIRAQSRDVWERNARDEGNIILIYLKDTLSLLGLLATLTVTLSLTSTSGTLQNIIVNALNLHAFVWLRPALILISISISILANLLLFLWIFWRLPKPKPNKKAWLRGSIIAAVAFEFIKSIMKFFLPLLASSPSGATFGSVIGLMAFFYLFACLILFCAAWIATEEYDERKKRKKSKE